MCFCWKNQPNRQGLRGGREPALRPLGRCVVVPVLYLLSPWELMALWVKDPPARLRMAEIGGLRNQKGETEHFVPLEVTEEQRPKGPMPYWGHLQ